MSKTTAGGLIIRNLRLFEDATKLLYFEVEPKIFGEIDRISERWADHHKWDGAFDWWNSELWLAPRNWMVAGSDAKWFAWFELSMRRGDDEGETEKSDYWYLTRLCGVGANAIGFKWYEDGDVLGTRGNRIKWKAFVRERVQPFEKLGFEFEEER
jgi:hypothetical protein